MVCGAAVCRRRPTPISTGSCGAARTDMTASAPSSQHSHRHKHSQTFTNICKHLQTNRETKQNNPNHHINHHMGHSNHVCGSSNAGARHAMHLQRYIAQSQQRGLSAGMAWRQGRSHWPSSSHGVHLAMHSCHHLHKPLLPASRGGALRIPCWRNNR